MHGAQPRVGWGTGRLLTAGELDEVLPLEDAQQLEQGKPITRGKP